MRRWMSILLLNALIFTGCSDSGPSSERHANDCDELLRAVFKDALVVMIMAEVVIIFAAFLEAVF